MTFFLVQLINGLKMGSIYALIAIGYSFVYGILRLINFAHGDLLMIATYSAWALMAAGVPVGLAIVIGIIITLITSLLMERFAYRPLRKANVETTLMTSLAVSVLLQNIVTLIFSPQIKAFKLPDAVTQRIQIGSVQLQVLRVLQFPPARQFLRVRLPLSAQQSLPVLRRQRLLILMNRIPRLK